MISIEKINEVHLRVYADAGIEQELSQFFTFEVPGYKFMPSYKAGFFDGKIRLYNLGRKTLYAGLLDYVLTFAKTNEYEVKFLNQVTSVSDITPQEVVEFTSWLNLHGRGQPIAIRDYQLDAIYQALKHKRRLLLSPTASGKSCIIYSIVREMLEHDRKCIIIVPTISLVHQMRGDFEDYSSANGWKTDHHCQLLHAGLPKVVESDILITTWQSIFKQPKAWFNQFDVAICDEAHLAKGESLTGIFEKMTDIEYRYGLTGTLNDSKCNKLVLEGLFGPVYKVISTRQLMDDGSVTNLKIKCLVLKYDEITRKMRNKNTYHSEMDFLVTHEKRNKFIRNLAVSCEGNTLVLFQFVEKHGKILYEMIKNKVHDQRKVFFIYGGTEVEAREEARKLTEKETDAIIIASFAVFSTGVNIPSIENVIFASSSKSKIRNLQSIGRGLRLKDGKTHCTLFDISDDLHYKSWKNYSLSHLQERIKTYAEEKFQYRIIDVELE